MVAATASIAVSAARMHEHLQNILIRMLVSGVSSFCALWAIKAESVDALAWSACIQAAARIFQAHLNQDALSDTRPQWQ